MSLRRILHISVLVMWIFTISGCAGSFRPNEKEAKLRWGQAPGTNRERNMNES